MKFEPSVMSFEPARLRAVSADGWPFLRRALFTITGHRDDRVQTAAVDKWWRVYYNPTWFATLTPLTAAAVLVHELWHLLLFHAYRASVIGVTREQHFLWNLAIDLEIHANNPRLYEKLCEIPECKPIHFKSFDITLPRVGVAETWFKLLLKDEATHKPDDGDTLVLGSMGGQPVDPAKVKTLPVAGGGVEGSGANDHPEVWEKPPPAQGGPSGVSNDRAKSVIRQVAEDIRSAAKSSRGTMEGGMLRWANEVIQPKVDWREHLGNSFQGAIAHTTGLGHRSYGVISRRLGFDDKIINAGQIGYTPRLAVIVDTSSSMSNRQVSYACQEVKSIISTLESYNSNPQVYVYPCDAAVSEAQRVWSGDEVKLIGGGGTDLRVAFEKILKDMADGNYICDVVVCITDAETPWPQDPFPVPIITLLVGRGHYPKWLAALPNDVIKIDPSELV